MLSAADVRARIDALSELHLAMHGMLGAERRLRPRHRTSFNGLTILQTVTLIGLDRAGTATMGELADYANVNPATVTGMLDELEAAKIVVRQKSADDRRVTMVSLTARGKKLAAEQRQGWEARWHQAFDEVSVQDIYATALSIQRITAIFEAIANSEPVPEGPSYLDPEVSFEAEWPRRVARRDASRSSPSA